MKRLITACILLLGLVLPCGAGEPLRIGVTLGLTGKYAEMSGKQIRGFRLWEQDINKGGGILGRKVTLLIYDDKSDPQTARTFYEHFITKDKVDFLFGPYSSEITEAVLPVTEKYRYPLLVSGAAADRLWEKGYGSVFGLYNPASKYAIGFLELLLRNDVEVIAIVHGGDSFSRDVAQGAKKWAERFGLNVVMFEEFRQEPPGLEELAKKARASGSQALILCGHFNEAVSMRLALKKTGWSPKAFFATVGPVTQTFLEKLGPDADLVFSSSQWEYHGGMIFPGCCEFSEFYEAYLSAYKEEPSYHAATAYAAGQILRTAILKAGSTDRERVRNTLSRMDTMSILGRFGVDRRGMQIRHFNLIIQWQKGKKEIVWPEELRTAKPLFR